MTIQTRQPRYSRTFSMEPEPDLRRRATEEVVDRLLRRAGSLPERDRALLRAVYCERQSTVELAKLLGETPRQVRRRLRRLVARVLSPEFVFVLRHRDAWPRERAEVATLCIVLGKTMRQAAREMNRSVTQVRSRYREILAVFEVSGEAGGPVGGTGARVRA
jgi:DNA-directed RNA polymerase specialized sigma24 family protein